MACVTRSRAAKATPSYSELTGSLKDEDGATAIEYVLIAALISVAAIAAMGTVGNKVSTVLSNVANAMT